MRIGVDWTCWANGRGYGCFARELLGAILPLAPADHQFVFVLDPTSAARFDLSAPNVRTVTVRQSEAPTVAAAAGGYRSPSRIPAPGRPSSPTGGR